MVNMLQRSLAAMLLITMLLNLPPVFGSGNYSEVIVEFSGSVADGPQSIDSGLAAMRSLGYDFEMVEKLESVMHGAVIRISTDQVERLKGEDMVSGVYTEKFMKANLDKSLKMISAEEIVSLDSEGRILTGEGVRIAVVDTGIDYTHNDLLGSGEGGKVVGGYDFLDGDDRPMDTDGHGTLVAGIIAADGRLKGVAPKAELIAYRVASEDSYVSTIDMVRALERAVDEGVDIVNISLGLDYISEEIDRAVENLVKGGIVVVTAVGNSGETGTPIGSPASSQTAISVGASLNDAGSSLVSTLRIEGDDARYDVVPMRGLVEAEESVTGRLVFANFATEEDVEDMELGGTIVLAERGGPLMLRDGGEVMQLVYFSEKEQNVAGKGAAALIIYNNQPGMFYGMLVHDDNAPGYEPSIPVLSVSKEEGLRIRELAEGADPAVELRIFSGPDVVARFSSRGPVSPFYMKPDLVAPGAFVNSTMIDNSYQVTSGTSFAAPHVAGAAALLLQRNPELEPGEIASILATSADPMNDRYDATYSYEVAGAGGLNVTAALESKIIAMPHYAILYLSSANTEASRTIELRALEGALGELAVSTEWNDPAFGEIVSLDATIGSSTDPATNGGADADALVKIDATLLEFQAGKFEGKLYVGTGDENRISIPLIVYADEVAVKASNRDGRIWLSVDAPDQWRFAKVMVTNPEDGGSRSVTLTPSSNLSSIPASSVGEHWIEADVVMESGDARGSSVLYVNDISPDGTFEVFSDYAHLYGIPLKQVLIIAAFLSIATAVTLVWTRRKGSKEEALVPST